MLEFFVAGKPEPQGSSRAFVIGGRARITSANAKLKPWRKVVGQIASEAVARAKLACPAFDEHQPVRLIVQFVLARPKSAPRARTLPVVKPDVDKLLRGLCDALTGIVWQDDAQVVTVHVEKRYGAVEGTKIIVRAEE